MDEAIDRTGVVIRAKYARRGGHYICPECRIRVIYAAGRLQAPHFRHNSRTPAERNRVDRCSLYVAEQLGNGGEGARFTREAPEPLRPRLAFAWAGKNPSSQRWGLLVTVPPPPPTVSFLHVEENLHGVVDVAREVARAQRSVWVKARSIQYQVIGYEKSRRPVWRPEPTDLLRTDQPNLFDVGVNGGTQLAPAAPLVRGGSYLTLSRRGSAKVPGGKLSRPVYRLDACDPRGEWDGNLVYIPVRREAEIERWAGSVCGRDVVDPPPRLDLVLPAFRAQGPDGVYDINSGVDVVLAVRGGEWQSPLLELVDEETGNTIEWSIDPSEGDYISMGEFPPGQFAVHLREWECVTIRLAPSASMQPVVAGVTIRSAPLTAGPEFKTPLFSAEASQRWGNILSGHETWRGIDVPESWPIALSWRSEEEGENVLSDIVIPSSLTRVLEDCLASAPKSAILDAGAFGRVEWSDSTTASEPETVARSLPAELSRRISWLLAARWSAAGTKLPLGLPIPHRWWGRTHPSQTRLVAGFFDLPDWPPNLLPLARSVGRDLSTWFKT